MANLSITRDCNRACAYCFARDALQRLGGADRHMSRETFLSALRFLKRSGIDQLRLLGGEPSVHPDFPRMVEQGLEEGFRLRLFTNGLMPECSARALAQAPPDRVHALVNVHAPADRAPGEGEAQTALLRQLGPRATLGYNLHRVGVDLGFLLDAIDDLGLARQIRLGLGHSTLSGDNRFLSPRAYPEVGAYLAAFGQEASRRGVELDFDCGFVPCMFPREFWDHRPELLSSIGLRCGPVPDILPDGVAVACYPLAELAREPLAGEVDAAELRARLQARLAPVRTVGVFRECEPCPIRLAGNCSGGCLAAALLRLRRGPAADAGPALRVAVTGRDPVPTPSGPGAPPAAPFLLPYIDQPIEFWDELRRELGDRLAAVYFPLPGVEVGSGRPPQAVVRLEAFLAWGRLPCAPLVNPYVLPRPAEELVEGVVEALRELRDRVAVVGLTLADPLLGRLVKARLPELPLTASTLMEIGEPHQLLQLADAFDGLVPAGKVLRDLAALRRLRQAFRGRLRLLVNEGCLPGCLFRKQHFVEMSREAGWPASLCGELLRAQPWLALTAGFVLPQHLSFYAGLHDELKLAGRVTLQDPERYRTVVLAYRDAQPLAPSEIGGGPPLAHCPPLTEAMFRRLLTCGRKCDSCAVCRAYHAAAPRPL